ncbi:MAG TPA: hybrid sensor histidine kinase/response regulator [Kofleriaceae bacterium]
MTVDAIVRVLVVDDQETVLADFARLLEPPVAPSNELLDEIELALGGTQAAPVASSRRYHLRYLRQGDDAVREVAAAAAAGSPFGVAFVDVQMPPGIDGVETVARMWRDQPDLEVVLCTAYSGYSWEALLERLTAHDQLVILRKPFDPIEVRQLAACLSEKWRRGRKLAERVISLEARVAAAARMQIELERAQKFDALGRLAAGIAHEISTPAQSIQSNLEYIAEGMGKLTEAVHGLRARVELLGGETPVDDTLDLLHVEIPQALADAGDGLRRVSGIVRSVRDYAHPSRQHEPVDVNRQIRAVVELARSEYKHDADLVLELGALPMVPGHADELGSVILNLLVNAAQAIHGARDGTGPRGRITITSRATAEHVVVEVADTGPGIAEADRDLVFELFYTTKPIGEGTGQGLAIARATVVDGHHGSLTFESEPGRGTTFRICLPLAR